MWKEIKEQYEYLWWWMLNQGLFVATLIVNSFLATVYFIVMLILYFFMRWFSKH